MESQLSAEVVDLLQSYYRLWSEHPDIRFSWRQHCQRVSITTALTTEHVIRVNAQKHGQSVDDLTSLDARRLDERTSYLNRTADPARWTHADVDRMLDDIDAARHTHPHGFYHLDCSSYYLAHLVLKARDYGLEHRFAAPVSIVHAYEFTPRNVRRFLLDTFNCPVVDLFGSTELGYLYYSDRHGRYRPYLDNMHLELAPVEHSESIYSLIVSSVRNPSRPLIRYRCGDCVQTTDGSADPAKIRRFCGREKELLTIARGGVIAQADFDDHVHLTAPAVFVYQLHVDDKQLALHYTTFDGVPLASHDSAQLQQRIRDVTGMACMVVHRAHIAPGKSGKYAWLVRSPEAAQRSLA